MRHGTSIIHGIKFGFVWGGDGGIDGLVINPADVDLTSATYQEALKIACDTATAFAAYQWVDERLAQYPDARRWEPSLTEKFLRVSRFVLEQTYWDVNDELREKINAAYAICINRNIQPKKKNPRRNNSGTDGYVYLTVSPSGLYKIGRTSDPDNRIKTFSVKLPFEIEYVCIIRTPDMYQLETRLHRHFAHKRMNGEFFALEPADVDYIKSLAVQHE